VTKLGEKLNLREEELPLAPMQHRLSLSTELNKYTIREIVKIFEEGSVLKDLESAAAIGLARSLA